MRKYALLFVLAISVFSTTSFAYKSDDCPLKNLRKSQMLKADGTAYFPTAKKAPAARSAELSSEVWTAN